MSNRLVITTHRPVAGQELIHSLIEGRGALGLHAFSRPSAWPAEKNGSHNRESLNQQPPGLTCHVAEELTAGTLAEMLREIDPGAIIHTPFCGLPASFSAAEEYRTAVNDTLLWMEAARLACPKVPFIHISSSLVYGDRTDTIARQERGDRFEFTDPAYLHGITEYFPIEGSTHSMLGAAAVAADVLAQEFFRSYFLPVMCLRIDSLSDPGNGNTDRRDFLSQIVHCCLTGAEYVVAGDRGRQLRDVVSARDLSSLIESMIQEPHPGEVYNVGGGKPCACSIQEAIKWVESLAGKPVPRQYSDTRILGEPRCYFANANHLRYHYPKWRTTDPWKELARRTMEFQSTRLTASA